MATIRVDNKDYQVNGEENLLSACLGLGFDLPYFCWHPAMGSVGSCRQCAIKQYKDESDAAGKIVMACMTPAKDGSLISIADPEVHAFRGSVIEWLMTNHPHDCPTCEEGGECHLQDMTQMTGHIYRRYRFKKRTFRNQYLGPFINHEMNRCIACYRCVRFYREYAGGNDLDVFFAHNHVYFGRSADGVLQNEFSGNLVEVCPTGVFTDKTLGERYTRKWDLRSAPSICHHCGLGCNISPNERYGKVKRIVNRYNSAVNGYFICDRGRFGYDYVNGAERVQEAWHRESRDKQVQPVSRTEALAAARNAFKQGRKVIGIGSPRASIETNFALRQVVGKDNFHTGLTACDEALVAHILSILRDGPASTPSLGETSDADAVLVLGEDVSNTAPRLALALRQATRWASFRHADEISVPRWLDSGVRDANPGLRSPLMLATPGATRLDDAATQRFNAPPQDLARLGFAVAHALKNGAPGVEDISEEMRALAETIAAALKQAKRPLIVSGTGCQDVGIVRAAANIAWALQERNGDALEPAKLTYCVPEANTLGAGLLEGLSLETGLEALANGAADTIIIAENDLYRRAEAELVDAALDTARQVIVLEQVFNATTAKADLILPAATFAGADGTLINNEGRAQRFFGVLEPNPDDDVFESWRWLSALAAETDAHDGYPWTRLDQIIEQCAHEIPALAKITEAAPPADYRIAERRMAREPHRYSGRTAMHANTNVHEPEPPADPDSPFSYTMEGHYGRMPSSLIPFFWAPGWDSEQAVNKFQDEIAGPLRGGDPGVRLVEADGEASHFFADIPKAFSPPKDGFELVPLYEVFGSDELSALSLPLKERLPKPYVALNPSDAQAAELSQGTAAVLIAHESRYRLTVRIEPALASGTAGVPMGFSGLEAAMHVGRGRLEKEHD